MVERCWRRVVDIKKLFLISTRCNKSVTKPWKKIFITWICSWKVQDQRNAFRDCRRRFICKGDPWQAYDPGDMQQCSKWRPTVVGICSRAPKYSRNVHWHHEKISMVFDACSWSLRKATGNVVWVLLTCYVCRTLAL